MSVFETAACDAEVVGRVADVAGPDPGLWGEGGMARKAGEVGGEGMSVRRCRRAGGWRGEQGLVGDGGMVSVEDI